MALLLGLFWHPTTSQGRGADIYAAVPLTTESCPAGYTLVKFDSPSGTQTQGPITLIVTSTQDGEPKTVTFTASSGTLVYIVYVKGGTGFRTYDYRPGGTSSGSGLVAPVNPNNNKTYGISHVTFCYDTPVVPTNTAGPPTETPVDTPTDTAVPPTETPVDTPTDTTVPPTETPVDTPTDTTVPPTSTEVEGTVVVRTPTEVVPTPTTGDHPVPNCPEGYLQIKFEDPSGTQTQGPITITVTRSEDGEAKEISFTVADGTVVYIVYVKGGPGYRTYDYRPIGTTSGSGLVAPINPNNGKTYGISHVTFCYLQEGTPTPSVTATDTPTVPSATATETPTDTPTVPSATATSTPTDTPTVPSATATSTPTGTIPTSTAVLGTVVVRTPTSPPSNTEVVPTSTEVASTVVVQTPTEVEGTVVVRTPTEVEGTVVVPTPTEGSGGDVPTPTGVVLPDSAVRTQVPGVSPGSPDSVMPGAPTSVVLPSSDTRPSTMPLTAGEDSLALLKLLIMLAFGFMGMGLCFRGFDLRRLNR